MKVHDFLLVVPFYFNFQTRFADAVPTDAGDDDYVLNFDSALYVCGDEKSVGYFDTSRVETSRFNETNTWITGEISFLEGINAKTFVEVYVEKETSGRYDLVMSHEICDLCEEVEKEESKYYKYLKNIDFPNACPIPPGEYTINNFVLYGDYLPVNKGTAGRYQVTLNFYSWVDGCIGPKTFIGCLKLDVVIEPK